MTQYWEPGTAYGNGDIVQYEGHRYKIIQPHRSQSDWAPPIVPTLWGRMQDEDHGHGHCDEKPHHGQGYQQPQQPQQPYQQNPPQYEGAPEKTHYAPEKVETPEEKKNWLGLDEDDAKKLKIGGGLAAGAALLAGGLFAYKEHEKHKEHESSHQQWVSEAQARTQQYNQYGPSGPATWVLNHGKTIPPGAIVVGPEHSWTLYIARAFYDGSIQVGKASDAFQKGAVIGYSHDEIHLDTYEILLGDMNALRWVRVFGKLNVSSLGYRPVEGGRENDGTPLYVAKAEHKGVFHPGKASEKLDGAFIPYDGTEKKIKEYEVLCYNN